MPALGKDALRKAALDARKALVASLNDAQRAKLEGALASRLTALVTSAKIVAGYAAIGSEISVAPLMEEVRALGRIAAYPNFDRPGEPFTFRAGDPRMSGPFGMLQPGATVPEVEPDLVFVPLVAADRHGTRLGRGKGHYDRVLARMRRHGATLVGVGWDLQLLRSTIPADEWDVPLDGFASPAGLSWFKKP